jgi:two-component system alkaline phosphatase synthesis response regulator PhoP
MGHKVLLVDDDNEFRSVLTLALESFGYRVIAVADGKTALEILKGERPDAIISDLHMPLMDGRTFCKQVRSETGLAEIPFVILSAYIESDGSSSLPDTPADHCFSKQDSVSALLPLLESLIVAAKQRRSEKVCES